jgi:hypothetical protein
MERRRWREEGGGGKRKRRWKLNCLSVGFKSSGLLRRSA